LTYNLDIVIILFITLSLQTRSFFDHLHQLLDPLFHPTVILHHRRSPIPPHFIVMYIPTSVPIRAPAINSESLTEASRGDHSLFISYRIIEIGINDMCEMACIAKITFSELEMPTWAGPPWSRALDWVGAIWND
jgi:hypothetical protein